MKAGKLFYFFLILWFPFFSIFSAELFEAPVNVDDLNLQVIKILNDVTINGMKENDTTLGFSYRYEDKWHSSFHLNVYLTKVNKSNKLSLIRIESPLNGTEKIFKTILEAELLKQGNYPEKNNLERKKYFFSGLFAIIHPAAGVYYNSYKSPLYTSSDRNRKMTNYIFTDLLITGAAIWYAQSKRHSNSLLDNILMKPEESKNPLHGKNSGIVIGALLTTRLVRLVGGLQDTAAHNNLIRFFYSKNY